MVDEMERRPYQLRKRADAMAQTRRRIVEAIVALHGSVGPADTTVAAIAERAGVQRHTVYRHFPTEADLFTACTTHYWTEHPWPDPAGWDGVGVGVERLAAALDDLYHFYADIAPMMTNVLRDASRSPLVADALAAYDAVVDDLAHRLGDGTDGPLVVAAVRHALDFRTWHSLVARGGVASDSAVRLMVGMVRCATR